VLWTGVHAAILFMRAFLQVVDLALATYTWVLVACALLYWLIGFNRVDPRGRFAAVISAGMSCVTEPVLRPLRRCLPRFGGVDASTLVAIMLIMAIRYVIALYILPNLA
jgi:YggT family protein